VVNIDMFQVTSNIYLSWKRKIKSEIDILCLHRQEKAAAKCHTR